MQIATISVDVAKKHSRFTGPMPASRLERDDRALGLQPAVRRSAGVGGSGRRGEMIVSVQPGADGDPRFGSSLGSDGFHHERRPQKARLNKADGAALATLRGGCGQQA